MQVAVENPAEFVASVARAESGENVVVTRDGVAVARLVPMHEDCDVTPPLLQGAERDEAMRRLRELMDKGIPLGGTAPTRDEMHER